MSTLEDRLKLLEPAPASDALRGKLAYPGRAHSRAWRTIPLAAAAAALVAVFIFAVTEAPHGRTTSTAQAEADFRKIEDTLNGATSLRVRFRREGAINLPDGRIQKVETSGTLLLKGENRAHVTLIEGATIAEAQAKGVEHLFVSDGVEKQALVRFGNEVRAVPGIRKELTGRLRHRFVLALVRESIATPGNLFVLGDTDLESMLTVSDVQAGADDSGLKTLTYKVGHFDARLWYDPKTFLPVKRVRESKILGTFTETYEEVVLNPEIPDDAFKMAEMQKK